MSGGHDSDARRGGGSEEPAIGTGAGAGGLPDLPGVLTPRQIADTAEAIAACQLPNGAIQWFPGGHIDPWNHTEAAMGLVVAGRRDEALRAYEWLAATQHPDGGWHAYYWPDGSIEEARRDTNVSSYVAVGAFHHWRITGDRGFVEEVWPMVSAAVDFAVAVQQPGGEVLWSYEPPYYALLTGSSSVFLSLRSALAVAAVLGFERPEWEVAALKLGATLAHRADSAFEPKRRWAMDWYYPVLCGALRGPAAGERIDERWDEFVMPGFGVRCVSDNEWVTAAETAECVLTLDTLGRTEQARRLLTWVQYLRDADGSYWTGCVHPREVHFPAEEKTTYTAAAMLLAADALAGLTPAGGLFRGDGLPDIVADPELLPEPD